jgi:hypothetical protein
LPRYGRPDESKKSQKTSAHLRRIWMADSKPWLSLLTSHVFAIKRTGQAAKEYSEINDLKSLDQKEIQDYTRKQFNRTMAKIKTSEKP